MRHATDSSRARGGEQSLRPAVYQNAEERDAHLESTYTYDRSEFDGCYPTTLLLISDYREELAEEFYRRFSQGHLGGTAREAFGDWQEQRFGRELDSAARGILWNYVYMRVVSGPSFEYKRKRACPIWKSKAEKELWTACVQDNPKRDGEGIEDYLRRIAVYAGDRRMAEAV
jgi:hypothetical protein